ncbi:MAG: glycine cleavage system aminomethyltransferase GcvT [Candidatus Limnocylindrales bacterium]
MTQPEPVDDDPTLPAHASPLAERHRQLGAKVTSFGGWEMPLQYAGILEEHRVVRERAGLFDLSHMGELFIEGPAAGEALATALVSEPPRLAIGRAQYSLICAPDGGILDDLIVYRLAEDRFMVVANAGNAALVSDLLAQRVAPFRAILDDHSLATALCAVQGPRALEVVGPLTDFELDSIHYYGIAEGAVAGIPALVARTGYTGEDGFEIFVDTNRAIELWDALMLAGRPVGLAPIGLGARDTLRLEAGMALYGNELDPTVNPYEARLGRVVRLEQAADFVGRDALRRIAAAGPDRLLVGLAMTGRGIARHGYPVHAGGRVTGTITSGTLSPTLGRAIAMAYVAPGDAEPGTILEVEIRAARVASEVVPLPFYRRPR